MDVMDAGQLKSIRSMKRLGSLKKSPAMSICHLKDSIKEGTLLQKCQIWVGLRACSHFWANWVPGSPIFKSTHPGLRKRSFMCDVYNMILVRTSFELKTSSVSSAHSFVAKISSPQSSPPCAPPATACFCRNCKFNVNELFEASKAKEAAGHSSCARQCKLRERER